MRRVITPCLLLAALSVSAVPAVASAPSTTAVAGPPQCATHDHSVRRLAPHKLRGPAAGSATRGVVTTGWSVDHGSLKVRPPAPGDVAAISRREAACSLLAGNEPNNFSIRDIVGNGSVIGLGRLTVARHLHHRPTYDGTTDARPDRYDGRLAWILTVNFAPPSSCGSQPGAPAHRREAAAPGHRRHLWDYEVFAIDAQTGGSALTYIERRGEPCGGKGTIPPFVSVPAEQVSLPWTLISMSHNRKHAVLATYFAKCPDESIDGGAAIAHRGNRVEVTVKRSYGPACGTVKRHVVWLTAWRSGDRLPRHLAHERVGPIDWPRYA